MNWLVLELTRINITKQSLLIAQLQLDHVLLQREQLWIDVHEVRFGRVKDTFEEDVVAATNHYLMRSSYDLSDIGRHAL